jgi:tetraacyldisaccharide 4'-kinase
VSDGTNVLVNARTGGDEPVELARKLIGKAIVVADADRVSAAKWAKEKFGITAFVLDDGFQHRRAKRDLDIVCIDATNPFGGGSVLPAGRLREPIHNLERADVFVMTRANLIESTGGIVRKLRQENAHSSIFESTIKIVRSRDLDSFLKSEASSSTTEKVGVYAFCALGNPQSFVSQLKLEGFGVEGFRSFDDHHNYSQRDIDELEADARSKNSGSLITTAKDAVKVSDLKFTLPCYVAEADVFLNDQDAFRDLVLSV